MERSDLIGTIMSGNLAQVKTIVESGELEVDDTLNDHNETALMIASEYGYIDIVKYLVETHHCNMKLKNSHNQTALDIAISKDHTSIIEYLENY